MRRRSEDDDGDGSRDKGAVPGMPPMRSSVRPSTVPKFDLQRLHVREATDMPFHLLYNYWVSKCRGETMPLRRAIDPVDLKRILPRIAVIEVLRDPLRFRYRLAGTQVCDIHGIELTGMFIDALEPPSFAKALQADLAEIVATGEGQFIRWNFLNREGIRRNYGVLRLPLSLDGHHVDQIIVCSDYGLERQALRDFFDAAYGRRMESGRPCLPGPSPHQLVRE